MLERTAGKTEHFGFLISCELEAGKVTTEQIMMKLSDSVSWVEGVGETCVECLGKIDVYTDDMFCLECGRLEKECKKTPCYLPVKDTDADTKCTCFPWDGIHAVDCPLNLKDVNV